MCFRWTLHVCGRPHTSSLLYTASKVSSCNSRGQSWLSAARLSTVPAEWRTRYSCAGDSCIDHCGIVSVRHAFDGRLRHARSVAHRYSSQSGARRHVQTISPPSRTTCAYVGDARRRLSMFTIWRGHCGTRRCMNAVIVAHHRQKVVARAYVVSTSSRARAPLSCCVVGEFRTRIASSRAAEAAQRRCASPPPEAG